MSSPKPTLTARHSFSTVHNGDMMLDMNEDTDTFTKHNWIYRYMDIWNRPTKKRILEVFVKAKNSDSLIINSTQVLTSS